MNKFYRVFAVLMFVSFLPSCAVTQHRDATTGEMVTNNKAIIGAAGAVAGGLIGAVYNKEAALLGLIAGGVAGGLIGNDLDNIEAELRRRTEQYGVKVKRSGDDITLVMPNSLLFDLGNHKVKQTTVEILQTVSDVVGRYDDTLIFVGGHTDSVGSKQSNEILGFARAHAVADVLRNNGVNNERLRAFSFGESRPLCDNSTEQGRACNRRVEIQLQKV